MALAEAKCAKLEEALLGVVASFEALQRNLTHTQAPASAETSLYLSKAALEIASYTKSCGMAAPFGCRPGQQDASSAALICAAGIVGERFLRASMDRTASLLANGQPVPDQLSPVLLEYLVAHRDRPLPADMMRQLGGDSGHVRRNIPMPRPFGNKPPALFRGVEGANRGGMVARLAPPHLQRLEYGLTRTWVETDLPGLTGEWLEAIDVEEYLSARGIFLHEDTESSLINLELDLPSDASSPASPPTPTIHTGDCPSIDSSLGKDEPLLQLATDIVDAGRAAADWGIFGKQIHQQHKIPSGFQIFASSSPFWGADHVYDESAPGMETTNLPKSVERQTHVVSLNVDKLIEGLALKTICLGSSPGIKRESVDEAIREAVMR